MKAICIKGALPRLTGAAAARAAGALWCAALVLSAAAGGSEAAPAPVDDGQVRLAIAEGVKFLYSRQQQDGHFPNRHSSDYAGRGEATAALALLRAGESPGKSGLKKTLQLLKTLPRGHTATCALRVMAFSLVPGKEYRRVLVADVQWLVKQQLASGGWGHGPDSTMTRLRPKWTDADNSRLALLALREAHEAGAVVSSQPFKKAEVFWRSFQNRDGGWGFQPKVDKLPPERPKSYGTTTAEALASYLILADALGRDLGETYRPGKPRKDGTLPYATRIARASQWLAANYGVEKIPKYIWLVRPGQLHEYLHCLQSAGDAAGLWTFNGHDYAADITRRILADRKPDGSWNDSVIDTAWAVLTLARARAPVAIHRLQLGPTGGRDPRDAANLASWLSRRLGTALAWRLGRAEQDCGRPGAALLYLNPRAGEALPPAAGGKLADFLRAGRTCLIQAPDAASAKAWTETCKSLLPGCRAGDLPADHPAFKLRFAIGKQHRPRIVGIGDRYRVRVFLLAEDVSGAWHQNRFREFPHLFELAGNLVLYASGGSTPPGKFAAASADPPPARTEIPLARLKHRGDFDVHPLAMKRLSARLAHSLSMGLKELPPADPAKPIDPAIRVLWLTGNTPPKLSPAEIDHLRKYLEGGGTLLADPAGGQSGFHKACLKLLRDVLGPANVAALPGRHAILTGDFAGGAGADVTKLTLLRPGDGGPTSETVAPKLWAGRVGGRVAAVLSEYGLTCSIEGAARLDNLGYAADDARKLALNVILYAISQPPAASR